MEIKGWKRYRPTTKYHYFNEATTGVMWSLCRLMMCEADEEKEQNPPMDKRCKSCKKRLQKLESKCEK